LGKPEKLVPKKGLFSFSLKPGVYDIYDLSLLDLKSHESQGRYEFEVKAGFVTYIGRIVTGVNLMENEASKKILKDLPFVSDSMLGKSDLGLFKVAGDLRSPIDWDILWALGDRRFLFRRSVLKDSLTG
jgi:hypothetical protein